MARIIFTIMGNKVQNVGYRLFLLQAMKEKGLVGIPSNLASGKEVHIRVWGKTKALEEFYSLVQTEIPKLIGKVIVTPYIIDNVKPPASTVFLNEKMDLMIEQTGRFVHHGRRAEKILSKNTSLLQGMPKKIGKAVSMAIKQV